MMDSRPRDRRVVVTGIASINPLGDTLDGFFDALVSGTSGIGFWQSIDVGDGECRVGGDLGDYDVTAKLNELKPELGEVLVKRVKRMLRSSTFSTRMATLCALKAYQHAGLGLEDTDPFRVGVPVGGHNFNSRYVTRNNAHYREDPDFIDPLMGVEGLDPNIPACIAEALGAHGPTLTVGGACASGNLALREGFRTVRDSECDVSVVCGAPFDMTPVDLHASVILSAVVVDPALQEDPTLASRPFDVTRAGFVPSHGAATIVLEELEHAKRRGANIIAEVLSVGANGNACHLPTPASAIQARLIEGVLSAGGVSPEDVDYVNCHATSTPLGDLEEVRALRTVFGDHRPVLNAPKSMLGHTCWAAPLVETVGGLLQMQRGVLHPTINVNELDPEVPFDVCADGVREMPVRTWLKNSFGFGGINCSSLFRQFEA